MDQHRIAQWLFNHGGPVIRYRVATEYSAGQQLGDVVTLTAELLGNAVVGEWLGNLKPYETMVAEQKQGKGLGAGGNSSFLHGSTDMNFEVVLPKLAQLGLRAGMPVLDRKTASWLHLLEAELNRDIQRECLDEGRFLAAVYAYYDYRLILASALALAGYTGHEAVVQILRSRVDVIYEAIKGGNFDLYEEPGKFRVHPKEWANHLLKWELYADGNIKLPFIHDIFGFACLYKQAGAGVKHKIGAILQWILAPEHQHFLHNFGYIRCPDGRGKSVGHKTDFPGYFGYEAQDFDPRSLVLRCWQMAHFPEAREHPWFQKSMQHLEKFITESGTYVFPQGYLIEARSRGYWIHGWRMGLGENRRNPRWYEIESTFWMLAIQSAMEGDV